MNYQVVELTEGKKFVPVLNKRTNRPAVYTTARGAATAAALLTKLRGAKFQPRPVTGADDWRDRERQRFAECKPVVWLEEPWWKAYHKPDHFAHVCPDDQTLISFIRDDKNGEAGVKTNIKPGKYLSEFFGDVLLPQEINTMALKHAVQFENKELKFATTVEDIERVYKPQLGFSCFSGTKKACGYASGDWAVAYIESNGAVTARAVCAPTRKKYVRIYGDETRLASLLKAAGYSQSLYSAEEYEGLRILKEHHWPGWYADFPSYQVQDPNDAKYLVIKSGR